MTTNTLRNLASILLLLLVVVGQGACSSALDTYYCSTDSDCSSGENGAGRCESTSLCSHADLNCAEGQRYSESAGESSGDCVGMSTGIATGADGGDPGDPSGADDGDPLGADGGDTRTDCDARFGQASDYKYCSDTSDSCRFSVDLDFDNCNDVCELLGSTCISAEYNDIDSQDVCTIVNDDFDDADCGSIGFSAICECVI